MDWITTSAILDDLRDFGNGAAWEQFVRAFRPAVEAYGRRLGLDAAAAEDVAQATMLGFAESYRRGSYDRETCSLRQWLFTIAQRRVVDRVREQHRGGTAVPLSEAPDLLAATTDWNVVWHRVVLQQGLEHLRRESSARAFSVFEATFVRQQPAAQVAVAFDMSESAVYQARYRLLARLRQLCKEFDDAT